MREEDKNLLDILNVLGFKKLKIINLFETDLNNLYLLNKNFFIYDVVN